MGLILSARQEALGEVPLPSLAAPHAASTARAVPALIPPHPMHGKPRTPGACTAG